MLFTFKNILISFVCPAGISAIVISLVFKSSIGLNPPCEWFSNCSDVYSA